MKIQDSLRSWAGYIKINAPVGFYGRHYPSPHLSHEEYERMTLEILAQSMAEEINLEIDREVLEDLRLIQLQGQG